MLTKRKEAAIPTTTDTIPSLPTSSSNYIYNSLNQAYVSVSNFLNNNLPVFLTRRTASLATYFPAYQLWKRGALGSIMDQAEAAASQHPSQICEFYIGVNLAAYVRKQEHIAEIYYNTPTSAHPIANNGDLSGIYPYLFGHSILSMVDTDPEYRRERIFYNSNLTDIDRLQNSTPMMCEAIQKHLKNYPLENITNIQDLKKFVNRIIVTMVAETQLGLMDLSEAEKDEIGKIVNIVLPEMSRLKLIAHLKLEALTGCRPSLEIDKVLKDGRKFLQSLLDRNRDYILATETDPKKQLFLNKFLAKTCAEINLTSENKITMADALRDHAERFASLVLFAGYESTSTSTFFTLLLLADPQHQEALQRVREEVLKHWDPSTPLTSQHLDKMVYADHIINESLRLYPPFPTMKDILNRDVKLDDVILKKGTILFISPLRSHQIESKINVENPKNFTPRAGLNEKNPYLNFFTFGPTPNRVCVGRNLARREQKIVLAPIVALFNFILAKSLFPIAVKEEYSLQLADSIDQLATKISFTHFDWKKLRGGLLEMKEEPKRTLGL